jgi:hypothetical protein
VSIAVLNTARFVFRFFRDVPQRGMRRGVAAQAAGSPLPPGGSAADRDRISARDERSGLPDDLGSKKRSSLVNWG